MFEHGEISEYLTPEEAVQIALNQIAASGQTLEQGIQQLTNLLQNLGIEGKVPPSDAERLRDSLLVVLNTSKPTLH